MVSGSRVDGLRRMSTSPSRSRIRGTSFRVAAMCWASTSGGMTAGLSGSIPRPVATSRHSMMSGRVRTASSRRSCDDCGASRDR